MRTTLDIDDDVLIAVKELARAERLSGGKILSRLARQALTGGALTPARADPQSAVLAGGFRPFARRGTVTVSNEDIERLRDAEGV